MDRDKSIIFPFQKTFFWHLVYSPNVSFIKLQILRVCTVLLHIAGYLNSNLVIFMKIIFVIFWRYKNGLQNWIELTKYKMLAILNHFLIKIQNETFMQNAIDSTYLFFLYFVWNLKRYYHCTAISIQVETCNHKSFGLNDNSK